MASAMESAVTTLIGQVEGYAPILFGVCAAIVGITLGFKLFKRFAA